MRRGENRNRNAGDASRRRVKKPDRSEYGRAIDRGRRNRRRFGIGAVILGAIGLGWLLWPSSQPRSPKTPTQIIPRAEAPEQPGPQLPTIPEKSPKSPAGPTNSTKETKPKGKTPEELEAERAERKFNTGIDSVKGGRTKIESLAANLKIKFDHIPTWKYNREDPTGWRKKIAENQLVLIGDFYGGQPYFGIVKSTNPLTFINEAGQTVYEGTFIPNGFYVQTIYGGTKTK